MKKCINVCVYDMNDRSILMQLKKMYDELREDILKELGIFNEVYCKWEISKMACGKIEEALNTIDIYNSVPINLTYSTESRFPEGKLFDIDFIIVENPIYMPETIRLIYNDESAVYFHNRINYGEFFKLGEDKMKRNECIIEKGNFGSNKEVGIKRVIFNNPATIILWDDGTKTVVTCQKCDTYDPEKGMAIAICKKVLGNKGNFNDIFKKWLGDLGNE